MSDQPNDTSQPRPDQPAPDQPGPAPEEGGPDSGGPPPLTEAEQEMLEQQMSEIRVEDLLTQTVASVLNLSARRIVKEDEIDLDQARTGIEAVRALVALLPSEVGEAVREPLSQVQMLYAQRSGAAGEAGPGEPGVGEPGAAGAEPSPGPATDSPGPGQSEPADKGSGSGLWTPRG
ncbi:MAG: hypothetical protein JJE10_11465, partial [Thermoleophilia bacterium]|nr:hypothetical protein [Thermoleophilia bacterium]